MPRSQMSVGLARILGDQPELAFEFYCAASEVVDDFEDYGPALQSDESGEYSSETAITRLQAARNRLIELLRSAPASSDTDESI